MWNLLLRKLYMKNEWRKAVKSIIQSDATFPEMSWHDKMQPTIENHKLSAQKNLTQMYLEPPQFILSKASTKSPDTPHMQ